MTQAYSWDDSQSNLPSLPPSTLTCRTKIFFPGKLIMKHDSTWLCQQLFIYVHLFLLYFLTAWPVLFPQVCKSLVGFFLSTISSILRNENSINFQVGFTGPHQAMEGIIAVGLDILVVATKHASNQYCKTLRHCLAPE